MPTCAPSPLAQPVISQQPFLPLPLSMLVQLLSPRLPASFQVWPSRFASQGAARSGPFPPPPPPPPPWCGGGAGAAGVHTHAVHPVATSQAAQHDVGAAAALTGAEPPSAAPSATALPSRALPQVVVPTLSAPRSWTESGSGSADSSRLQLAVERVVEFAPSAWAVIGTPPHERFWAKKVERFSKSPLGPSASRRSRVGESACTRYRTPPTVTTVDTEDVEDVVASADAVVASASAKPASIIV